MGAQKAAWLALDRPSIILGSALSLGPAGSPYSSAIFLRCTPSRIEIEGRCSIGHEAHGKSVESRQILLRQDSSE